MSVYRNTVQKDAVMKVLLNERRHMTAEQVFEKVKEINPIISRSTVFRILNVLSERGDILRVPVADGADCFDFTVSPHYHIRCVKCGEVSDVDMPYMEHIADGIKGLHGYKLLGHSILFSGLCPKCQECRER